MSHRLRAEGLPVKCLSPPPQAPVPEGEDSGTVLEWDGQWQCWDGMCMMGCCKERGCKSQNAAHSCWLLCFAPLLFPIEWWFYASVSLPGPLPLPLLLPSGSLWQERLQVAPILWNEDLTPAPDFAGRSQNLRRCAAAREGPASAASWCPLALPVPSGSQLARN